MLSHVRFSQYVMLSLPCDDASQRSVSCALCVNSVGSIAQTAPHPHRMVLGGVERACEGRLRPGRARRVALANDGGAPPSPIAQHTNTERRRGLRQRGSGRARISSASRSNGGTLCCAGAQWPVVDPVAAHRLKLPWRLSAAILALPVLARHSEPACVDSSLVVGVPRTLELRAPAWDCAALRWPSRRRACLHNTCNGNACKSLDVVSTRAVLCRCSAQLCERARYQDVRATSKPAFPPRWIS